MPLLLIQTKMFIMDQWIKTFIKMDKDIYFFIMAISILVISSMELYQESEVIIKKINY